ncbi:MAG: DUF4906 domain-containing protein [Bacteroidales bacterium]|nr:DUF4906 domain-containing protein [Bacteroidales bacterium]
MKARYTIVFLLALLGACTRLEPADPHSGTSGGHSGLNPETLVPVTLSLDVATVEEGMPGTKSDIYYEPEDPDFDTDDAIKTVLLLQFDGTGKDAELVGQQQYFDHWPLNSGAGEGFALVAKNSAQTVIVLANTFGYLTLTDHTTLGNFLENENFKEISTLAGVWHEVVDGGDNMYYLPMGGHVKLASVTASTNVNLTLRRNCAKVIINITNAAYNKTGDNQVIIEDVRICNVNMKHYYVTDFTTAGDADPFNFEDTYSNLTPMRFDAPEQTGSSYNDGAQHTLTYYLPANLRGEGANTTSSQKNKNLGAPLGATCFKIYAHYGDNENPIVYTYYLGGNLTNDFNLKPNTKYTYNITISGKGTPANDYRIADLGDRTEFKVDANCYMLLPPDRADKSITYTIPVRRAMVFWNAPGVGLGVYGASGGDNEVLTLQENTVWKASFVWNRIYDGLALASESDLLVGSVDDGTGKYVFSGKGFDPDYSGAAIDGHNPHFRIKVKSGMKGDALVALKNSAGVILWSWHLWVTDYDPDVEMTPVSGTYVYPVAGGALHRYSGTIWGAGQAYENAFIMDRNLGALSSYGEIGDTRGAWYQFGKKDPEPAGAPISHNSATADVLKAIHNPTVHYSGWWQNTSLGSVESPWNDPKLIGGTGHGGDNCEPDKSIYDPCPPGWRVPVYGVWSNFSSDNSEWFSSPGGRYYYPEGDPANGRIWYPAAGRRVHHGLVIDGVGTDGYYWTATPVSGSQAHYFRLNAGGVAATYNMERYLGLSVRCIRL